jgi:hypothetical protein
MPDVLDSLWSNALLLLVGAALLWAGSVVIGRMRREATETLEERLTADPLSPFEDAYRRGQMSDEEFQRIRRKLAAGGVLPAASPRLAPPPKAEAPPPAATPEAPDARP